MDFMLTEQQQMMKKLFAEFAEKEVKPLAAEVDEDERFPRENGRKNESMQNDGNPNSREYGGAGADYLSYILAVEELSKKCGTTGVVLSAHTSLGTWPIEHFGTPNRKRSICRIMHRQEAGRFRLNRAECRYRRCRTADDRGQGR